MATNYNEYEDDDLDNSYEESGDVVKQLRRVNRTLEKRLKELEQEASAAKSLNRTRTIKDTLTQKGINPKVAAFIPQDIEPSEEAINAWLTEYGDVFGAVQTDAQAPATEAKPTGTPDLSAQQRINNVVNTGSAPMPDEDRMAQILNAKTAEELNAILGVSVM